MNTTLDHIQDWMEIAKRADWSVSQMAKLCNVSPRTLERFFQKTWKQPPKAWMKDHRQKLAVKFLRNQASVKETAWSLGYKHGTHFSREFKKYWGFSAKALNIRALGQKNVAFWSSNPVGHGDFDFILRQL